MRRLAIIVALVSLALPPGRAAADASAHEPLYDAELHLDLASSYDRVRPEDPFGPLLRSSDLTPTLTARYYLDPLVGEAEGPLALLEFYQHPGHLQASLAQATDFNRVSSAWRTTQRTLQVAAEGALYPWHESGLLASVASSYAGVSADAHSAIALDYQLSLVHYFRPNLRGELGYVGEVSQTERLVSNSQQPALQDLEGATNTARVAGEAVLLDDRLGVRAQLDIGQFTDDRTNTSLGGPGLPGDFTHGLLFDAQGSVTGYFGRQFSATLGGGVRGLSADTQPDDGAVGTSTRTALTPFIAPSASYFFRDDLWGTLGYRIAFADVSAAGAPSSSEIDQALQGTVSLRF